MNNPGGRYEQMVADSTAPPSFNSFRQPISKVKSSSFESIHTKLFKLVFALCLGFIFVLVFYLSIARSSQARERRSVLLEVEANFKQEKAKANDIAIKRKLLEKEESSLQREKDLTRDAMAALGKENEGIQKNITDVQRHITYLKEELSRVSESRIAFEYQMKLHGEVNDLQGEMKVTQIRINKLRREMSDKREEGGSNRNDGHIRDQINSNIIKTQRQADLLKEWLGHPNFILFLEPCYMSSQQEFSASTFHLKCDGLERTLTLYKINNDNIIGGYAQKSWSGNGFKSDEYAFLFNLSSGKKYPVLDPSSAIYYLSDYYPSFGVGDLVVSNFGLSSNFPNSYGNNQLTSNELTLGVQSARVEEIEVLRVSFGQ